MCVYYSNFFEFFKIEVKISNSKRNIFLNFKQMRPQLWLQTLQKHLGVVIKTQSRTFFKS